MNPYCVAGFVADIYLPTCGAPVGPTMGKMLLQKFNGSRVLYLTGTGAAIGP